jgi:tetratricopeptide (TPR) repeat protein
MQTQENNDMDYLAQLGFEKVHTSSSDLKNLKRKIRLFRGGMRSMFVTLGALLLGMLIGSLLIIYMEDRSPVSTPGKPIATAINKELSSEEKTIILDTISLIKENFIKPHLKQGQKADPASHPGPAEIIEPKALDLTALNTRDLKEEKLKYMINAPVFYLHDLKITNYTTLYFKQNKFVKWSGLSAAYSNANEMGTSSSLKQEAEYYLHEEIARAMLLFKQGKYEQAMASLHLIRSYNKEDLNCEFYLGMCYYYRKNYAAAMEQFELCIESTNNTFFQEAQYYKALSLYETGDKEAALALFKQIIEAGEFYSEKAKKLLEQLMVAAA